MLAPSEKHLENWIVETGYFNSNDARCLQQYRLPSGITDLIYLDNGITLMELKRGKIDASALMQTARYLRDLKAIAKTSLDLVRPPLDGKATIYDPPITAMLIGHALDNDNLLIAAQAIGIDVLLYDYQQDTGEYDFIDADIPRLSLEEKLPFITGDIGLEIQEAYTRNVTDAVRAPDGTPLQAMVIFAELWKLENEHGIKPFYDIEGIVQ